MFDDDFSSETGRYADLNNDGKVDFAEYLNDCDDFDRIYKKAITHTANTRHRNKAVMSHPKYIVLGE